jgi:hypothetical protein
MFEGLKSFPGFNARQISGGETALPPFAMAYFEFPLVISSSRSGSP